jgi:hypothetical protein
LEKGNSMRELRLDAQALLVAIVGICVAATAASAQSTAKIESDAAQLVKWARAQFGDLSPAEDKLLRAAPTGRTAWCGPSKDPDEPSNDPAKAASWGQDRIIRAEVFRWLAIDSAAVSKVHPDGIQIGGAKFDKKLDLAFSKIEFPLGFLNCDIPKGIDLTQAKTREIVLSGSWTGPIDATRSAIEGDVSMIKSFRANGKVDLRRSVIDGDLICIASFLNPNGDAIDADGARVSGNVILGERRFFGFADRWLVPFIRAI